ncbi:MAG TPA: hypothetical protein PK504_05830 [Ferruginibacter sp.]|nr:hypothetical protein [Ferruginibacter sp.]HRE65039.1 hypothetical protein [Ferruginibacter sp.]
MKTVFFFLLCTIIALQDVDAKIWRINNQSNYNGSSSWGSNYGGSATYPVFKQINQAVSFASVVNGDTLYIEGASTKYDQATLTKRLVLIGAGYLLNENPQSSPNLFTSLVDRITLSTGSAGSQLIAIAFSSGINVSVTINTNDITVKRCFLDKRINIDDGVNNIKILQNYFFNYSGSSAIFWSGVGTPPMDIIFNNNICRYSLLTNGFTLLECKNNVFDPPNPVGNSLSIDITVSNFQNNILKNPTATVNINNGTNLNSSFNIATSATQFGTANNNIVLPDMSTLFVAGSPLSADGAYRLQQPQPLNQLGADGTERGVFGGVIVANRYMLSGLAAIPVLYELNTSGVGTSVNGLQVEIKSRTIQ